MANQFGETVHDSQAYSQARDALDHIDDLDSVEALADTPVKKAALADARRARSAPRS
ncbi:hypothetical protein [Amycolatopsis sp. cg9]|uniref:hypothetical protein n=1 Tax=Amycolatopsis sp. cg9 TaxID=3238801 RepID=UPI003525AC5A